MVDNITERLSAKDYYALPEYATEQQIQLIDGQVLLSMPPIPRHLAVVGEVLFLLMTTAKAQAGRAFTAPIEVFLDEHHIFQPDVLYLLPDTACVVEEKRLVGPPDLVVEVLSPSTAKFDRHEKFLVYETHAVREYWIVDPVHEVMEVFIAGKGGYVRLGAFGATDRFESPALKQAISVDMIF